MAKKLIFQKCAVERAENVFQCFYYSRGEWCESVSKATVAIKNPANGETVGHVQACSKSEVDEVFQCAKETTTSWARTPLWHRAELLHKAASILRERQTEMGEILMKEIAKARKDSVTEIVRSADLLDYTAEEGVRLLSQGKLITSDAFKGTDRNKLCLSSKVPLGVVLCIPPFNYPVNLAVSKIGPALMAGNVVVLKPPTQGAISGCLMADCFAEAGIPSGVLQVVTGRGSEIGDYLTQHPAVNCISFTGGDTGLSISQKAGMIPIQMELGGKDACIVCEDADLDLAAKHIVKGGFSYSGQRCTAVKVVLVLKSIADALLQKVLELTAKLSVGQPEDNCSVTPVISKSSADYIEGLIKDAEEKGATLCSKYIREGNLIYPLVVDNVSESMRLAWEEPFGPVVPFMRVESIEAAIEHCNTNRLALQGCVFTQNIDDAIRISDAMKTGTVQINSAPARGPDHFPFQGFRDSGIGSQGITNSIEIMTKTKTTVLNLAKPSYTLG